MHRRYFSAHPLLVALVLLLPGLLLPFAILPSTSASPVPVQATGLSVQSHLMTSQEAADLMSATGTYVEGADYNVLVDGHGTGLAPPTAAQFSEMVGNVSVTDSVQTGLMSQSSYDLSAQPYFPAVGNQGSQGSCAAWAMAYYDYGYLEAKDNNWTDASTGNPAHLMSPSWAYNRVDFGVDRGTFMDNVADVIADWGVATMATMPYVASDFKSWGNEAAAREAPLHRAVGVSYISYSSSNPSAAMTSIKNLISANTPVTFAIDANVFTGSLTDNIITANEYNSASMNHAQTIVGYDDARSDGVNPDRGAFKVVNSWGKNWGNGGYYWVSYDAMKKIGANLYLTYITDKPSYQPSLLGIIEFNNLPTRESSITVGVGTVGGSDKIVPYFEKNYDSSVTATFPAFMAIDMTELLAKYQAGKTSFYLTLGSTNTAGNVSSFRIEQYQNGYSNAATQVSGQSPDVPKINPGSVTVSMPPYATIAPQVALDNPSLSVIGSGSALWSPVTRDFHSGGSAMQSGNIGNGAKSAIQTTVLGPSTVSFWWKTSTEITDLVRFYVDSVNRANASGSTPWTQVSMAIGAGAHVLKWEYVKDASVAGNQDLVLLDSVVAISGSTAPSAPSGLVATVGSNIQLNWSAPSSNGGAVITAYNVYRGTVTGTETLLTSLSASSLTYTDTGAAVNRSYYYQVAAVNSVGESPRSNEAVGKIPITTPSPPTSLTATVGPSYIDLAWTWSGAGLTGFHLYRGTVVNGETLFQTLSSSTRAYRDSSVTAGTIYYYRMNSFNDQASSSYGNEVSARIPAISHAPTGLTASIVGSAIHLNWTAPMDNGGSTILNYRVYRGMAAGTESPSSIGAPTAASYYDLTAIPGIRYYYVVKACNAIGDSVVSNEATGRVPTVPGAPTSLSATLVGSHIHLSWTVPSDNGGAAIDRYSIYRGTFPGSEGPTPIGTTGATSYNDASAAVGMQYYYLVRAHNQVGESASSNEASSRVILAPDAPSSLTGSVTPGQVSLGWAVPSFNGGSQVTSYTVLRGTTSDPTTHVQIGSVNTPYYVDTQISVGQTYYYSVRAVNIVGSSVSSNVASVLVKGLPSAPVTLATQISDRSMVLSWSPPASNGFSSITGYKVYRSGTSGAGTLVATVTGMTFNDNGLVNGKVYYYRVSAVNLMGEGPQSAEVWDSPATVPAAPTIADARFSFGTVEISWSEQDTGGRAITGYSVYRGSLPIFASATLMVPSLPGNTYRDSSVSVGSTYYYFVIATNQIGQSTSGSSGPVYISSLPTSPGSVSGTITPDHIQVSWSMPVSSGSSSIIGYIVNRSLAPGEGVVIAHMGNVLAFNDYDVVLGQTYYYSVLAENVDGVGPLSTEIQVVYAHAPGAPTGFEAIGSVGAAHLSWSSPSDNGAAISLYTVRMWTVGGTPEFAGETVATSIDLTGLTDGAQYWFEVTATNLAGEGLPSSDASCMIGSVPGVPTGLAASVGNGSISISWQAPTSFGGFTDLTYQLWRSANGESSLIATLGDSSRSYSDSSVVPGTTYRYTIVACNVIGPGIESEATEATAATTPGAPSLVTVDPDTSSIQVAWSLPGYDGGIPLSGFNLYRSSGSGWTLLATLKGPAASTYRDQNVLGEVSYRYCVAGTNDVGESVRSSPSVMVSTLTIPSLFTVTSEVGDCNVTLIWSVPESKGTPLLGYGIERIDQATGLTTVTNVSSNDTRFIDETVIPGNDYIYKVTASNRAGISSADPTTVHAMRDVAMTLQVVPFQNSIAVSGKVADPVGQGMAGQKVTIYLSTGTTENWTALTQLTSAQDGKFAYLVNGSEGVVRLKVVLTGDLTHVPVTLDQTVSTLRLRNGGIASITSGSVVSEVTSSSSADMITFSLEQAGTANISIPKSSLTDIGGVEVMIDGHRGNYQVIEKGDQYVFCLNDVQAGQTVSFSIGQSSQVNDIPTLVIVVLMTCAVVGTFIVWGRKRKRT